MSVGPVPAPELAALAIRLKSRLFAGLTARDIAMILATAKQRAFAANSVVVRQGDPADHLFLLISGRARFFFDTPDGKKLVLLWLTPGEIFGGSALLPSPRKYLVSTETLKDSSILAWDRPALRSLVSRFPRLIENALSIANDYLTWYVADHAALTSQTAGQRLARVLVCLAEGIGQKVSGGFEFEATNEELASAANITQFTASRLLSEWQKSLAIEKRRGKVLLRSPNHLLRADSESRARLLLDE
jgi:CRP-like cAMP-binding protein